MFCTFLQPLSFTHLYLSKFLMTPAKPIFLQLSTTPLFCSSFTTPFFLVVCYFVYHPSFLKFCTTPLIHCSLLKHNICLILHMSAILDKITAAILNEHANDCHWKQPFLFHNGKQTFDFKSHRRCRDYPTLCIQATPCFYFKWTRHWFDPEMYSGADAIPQLVENL